MYAYSLFDAYVCWLFIWYFWGSFWISTSIIVTSYKVRFNWVINQDDRSANHHASFMFQVGVIQINEIDKLSPAMREIAENEINLLLKVSLCNLHLHCTFLKFTT